MKEGDVVCWQHTEEILGYDNQYDVVVVSSKPVFRSSNHVRVRIKKDGDTSILSYPTALWRIKTIKK